MLRSSVNRIVSQRWMSNVCNGEFIYTDTHMQLRSTVRKIIDTHINPFVNEWEAAGIFPAKSVFKTLGDAGLLGVTKESKYGGMDLDYSYSVAMAEEMGNVLCGAIPMAVGVQTDMATPALSRFGSDYVKSEFLAPTIRGDFVVCLGVSEIHAGSDVASIKTTAEKKGDEYVINGGKMWTTNGSQADWMCLLANTAPPSPSTPPHLNKTLFCLPMNTKGVQVSKRFDKLGMRSSDTVQVFFDNVKISQKNIIGEEGKGFVYQMLQFQEERMFATANVLASLDRIIDNCKQYCEARIIFGKPLLHNQVVQFRLSELQTEVEALRSLLYRTVHLYTSKSSPPSSSSSSSSSPPLGSADVTCLASMCKLKAGRIAREIVDACLQYYGGMGYMSETQVSRDFRDLRLISIGAGADEVMLSIISKYLFTPQQQPKKK